MPLSLTAVHAVKVCTYLFVIWCHFRHTVNGRLEAVDSAVWFSGICWRGQTRGQYRLGYIVIYRCSRPRWV